MSKFTRPQSFFVVIILFSLLLLSACTDNDNSHTTATTVVPPPRRQTLTVVEGTTGETPAKTSSLTDIAIQDRPGVDPTKPLLVLNLQNGKTFRVGEVVVLDFALLNAKLKADGGEYRVRYFIDDDDPRWLDSAKSIGLAGWMPGKHTIRLELIGPDGWPYRNGNQNIVTREITVLNRQD
jgi:hypothetical protein